VIHLRNGLGWVDAATGQHALPPDGDAFSVAPGATGAARTFHVVDLPDPVALVAFDPATVIDATEIGKIDALLRAQVGTVAFLGPEREGAAVVHARTGRSSDVDVATAAAALKAIGGWDESVPIVLNVDRRIVVVSMLHGDAGWQATAAKVDDAGLADALRGVLEGEDTVSLAHVNIDRLAAYNDAHGHDAGDLLLARLHGIVQREVARAPGRAYRRGIDDLVVLRGADSDDAVAWGEALCRVVANAKVPLEHPEIPHVRTVTVSVGIAHAVGRATIDDVMGAAGRALLDAKQAGRKTTRCRPCG
jgi:diguanylate cyclase (GGDEF)-like protein